MMGEKARLTRTAFRAGFIAIVMFLFTSAVYGQEPPPRPLEITPTQQLSFGAFTLAGAGGTVIIYSNGTRGASGSVIPLSLNPVHSTARFELVANPGTIISLLGWPSSTLTNGTQTMSFTIDSTLPVLPYVINTVPPNGTTLDIGGTLNVGSILANPAGSYNGTFNITFVQE
jgi:hypothetical protein